MQKKKVYYSILLVIFHRLLSFKLSSDKDNKIIADLCRSVSCLFHLFTVLGSCRGILQLSKESGGGCCFLSLGSSQSRFDRSVPLI